MFRRFLAFLSRHFPPKFISERILPWLTLLLVVFGGIWGLVKYGTDLDLKKVGLAIELHEKYAENFYNEKRRLLASNGPYVLRYRCEFLLEEIKNKRIKSLHAHKINCEKLSTTDITALRSYELKDPLRTELRNHVFSSLGKRSLSRKDIKALAELSIFFNSIIICVDHGNCDEDASIALFSREMTEFVNFACAFFEPLNRRIGQISGEETIAKFLLRNAVDQNIYWSLDPARQKLFACNYLRELEDASLWWRWLTY